MGAGHLVRRFFGSVIPGGPSATDATWATEQLLPGEVELWQHMSRVDRRHAAGVARRTERALGAQAIRPVLAAALLHDVGKVDAGLGTYGRVIATLSAKVAGRDQAEAWSHATGFTRNVGLYLRHSEIGAESLEMAGSDPLTVSWAREHHLPESQWTVPVEVGHALKAADDD